MAGDEDSIGFIHESDAAHASSRDGIAFSFFCSGAIRIAMDTTWRPVRIEAQGSANGARASQREIDPDRSVIGSLCGFRFDSVEVRIFATEICSAENSAAFDFDFSAGVEQRIG